MSATTDVEHTTKPGRGMPNAVRNVLAGLGIFVCLAVLLQALVNGAWLGAAMYLVAIGFYGLLTSAGKAWRARQAARIPGWLVLIGAMVATGFGSVDVDKGEAARQHRLFATEGEQILEQARSALRRGAVGEAQSLLSSIDDIDLPQVAALNLAAEAITTAKGDVDAAQQALLARARTAPGDAQLAQAAKALEMPVKPKASSRVAQPAVVAASSPEPAAPAKEVSDEGLPPPSAATLSYLREVLASWEKLQSCRSKPGFQTAGLRPEGPCGDLSTRLARLQADPQAYELMSHGFDCPAGDVRVVALSYAMGEKGPEVSRFRASVGKMMQACAAEAG